jgi:hypothetical protein
MIYTFKILSDESKDFLAEVKINCRNSFFDFHLIIQRIADFEPFQIASFFVSDEKGRKIKEISLMDAGINGGAYNLMQNTKLSDLLQEKHQKLIYTFDFINDRSFFIELTDIDMGTELKEPLVTQKQGVAPLQVLSDEFDVITSSKSKIQEEEEVFMDFGILDDYNELFGEMEDF